MHVLVIGGGPAGTTAALHAVGLGAEVTLVERGRIGGTALSNGPAVRTLARAARLVRDWNSWETFGVRGPRPEGTWRPHWPMPNGSPGTPTTADVSPSAGLRWASRRSGCGAA